MNITFRSRIGEGIDYTTLLNYGMCCRGITKIGTEGEHNYYSCYASGGVYIPYEDIQGNLVPLDSAELIALITPQFYNTSHGPPRTQPYHEYDFNYDGYVDGLDFSYAAAGFLFYQPKNCPNPFL